MEIGNLPLIYFFSFNILLVFVFIKKKKKKKKKDRKNRKIINYQLSSWDMISKNCIYDLSVGLCVLIGSNIFLFKSLFWNISLCNNLSTICQRSMGSQMEFVPSRNHVASTCSAFQSLWQHSFQLAEIAAPFSSSRGIATTSSMESAPQGSPAVDSDITPRIKFKRLDKTSKHIMQVFAFLSTFGKEVISFYRPVCLISIYCFLFPTDFR